MARLTIEQKWWIDPRRSFLQEKIGQVGGIEVDGLMVVVWRMAQEYWGQGELLPWRVFSKFRYFQQILDSDLAELRTGPNLDAPACSDGVAGCSEHFVYVRGSKDFFNWIFDIREKRRMAGKKSAESRKNSTGSAVPSNASNAQKSEHTPNKPEQAPNKRRTKFNKTELSGSGSGLGSGSDFGKESNSSNSTKASDFIAAYSERFKSRWGSNPPITGKEAGIISRVAKSVGQEKFEFYLDAYFAMPEAQFVKAKHPMNLFELKLSEISVFANSGKFHTQRQVREADSSATNAMLLAKIERGEI